MAGDAYQCEPYSRDARNIRGARIAILKNGDNWVTFASSKLRSRMVADLIYPANHFPNQPSLGTVGAINA